MSSHTMAYPEDSHYKGFIIIIIQQSTCTFKNRSPKPSRNSNILWNWETK